MAANPKDFMTLQEFLTFARSNEGRFEFINGRIQAMSGGKLKHDLLTTNMSDLLLVGISGKNCRRLSANMQIKVPALVNRPATAPFRYADVSVVRGPIEVEEYNGCDLLCNPLIIVEVLSRRTEATDRKDKFEEYKSIPSLVEYVLVSQKESGLTLHLKQPNGEWTLTDFIGLECTLYLPSLDYRIPLRDIYREVDPF